MQTFNQLKIIEKEEELSQKIFKEAENINIEEADKNKEGLLLDKDGGVSHYQNELYWKIIKTESFNSWFNGSVAVYEDNGEPMIVFHSTLKRDLIGTNLKPNEKVDDWNSYGVYFSSNKQATINYYENQYQDDIKRFERLLSEESGEKENISKEREQYLKENEGKAKTFGAFVKIKKPLELENHEKLMELSWAGFNRQDLLNEHDGIIIKDDPDFYNQYIVFKSNDILTLPSETK